MKNVIVPSISLYENIDDGFLKMLNAYFMYIDNEAEQNHTSWEKHYVKNGNITSKAHSFLEPIIVFQNILINQQQKNLKGDICEFGCYTGISSAKLSLLSNMLNLNFYVFDSFEGLPNIKEYGSEKQNNIYQSGEYCASIEIVRKNIKKFGIIKNVNLVKGWFSESLKNYKEVKTISHAFIDVDLCKSLEECLEYILPKLESGGIIFSHEATDPDYPPVFEKYGLLNKENFDSFGVGTGIQGTEICMFIKK